MCKYLKRLPFLKLFFSVLILIFNFKHRKVEKKVHDQSLNCLLQTKRFQLKLNPSRLKCNQQKQEYILLELKNVFLAYGDQFALPRKEAKPAFCHLSIIRVEGVRNDFT